MYKDDIHLFFTIVNAASHRIALKRIYLIRFFFIIPINIQKTIPDDPSDRVEDPLTKGYVYDRYRTFIENEDTMRCPLKHPLKPKPLYLLVVETSHGVCLRFFHPHNYSINIEL